MPGLNPAKGMRFDLHYTPLPKFPVHHPAYHNYQPGFFGKLFRFVFFSFIFVFFALFGLLFSESAGGPTPLNFSLVEILDKSSGYEESPRLPTTHTEFGNDFSVEKARLQAEFDKMAREFEESKKQRSIPPTVPPGFPALRDAPSD